MEKKLGTLDRYGKNWVHWIDMEKTGYIGSIWKKLVRLIDVEKIGYIGSIWKKLGTLDRHGKNCEYDYKT